MERIWSMGLISFHYTDHSDCQHKIPTKSKFKNQVWANLISVLVIEFPPRPTCNRNRHFFQNMHKSMYPSKELLKTTWTPYVKDEQRGRPCRPGEVTSYRCYLTHAEVTVNVTKCDQGSAQSLTNLYTVSTWWSHLGWNLAVLPSAEVITGTF